MLVNTGIFETRLALLDEIGILANQAGIQHQHQAVFGRNLSDGAVVAHGVGLPTDQVRGGFHTYVSDLVRAIFLDDSFQFLEIDVALEGIGTGGFEGVVAVDFDDLAAGQFDVGAGGGEMVVHRHHHARLDVHLRDDMFRSPTLMHR